MRWYCRPMRPASANTPTTGDEGGERPLMRPALANMPTTGDEGESALMRVVLLDSIALWLSPLSNFYLSHSTSAELKRGGRVKVKNSFRSR